MYFKRVNRKCQEYMSFPKSLYITRKSAKSARYLLYLAIILSLYSVTATGLAAQRLYDAQYPDFEPEGPDFEVTDESAISVLLDDSYILKFKKSWDTLPEGLQGSIGSVDHLYAKKSLPKLQSITNRWSGVAWRCWRLACR